MERFYTCVTHGKNELLYRGVNRKGERIAQRIAFQPTLYLPTQEESEFKNLYGQNLEAKTFDSLYRAKDFTSKYKEVEGFTIYGQANYINQFLQRQFPEEIVFDPSKIVIGKLDIETTCEDGFPDIDKAKEEIICATFHESLTGTYWVFSNKQRGRINTDHFRKYIDAGAQIEFIECDNEEKMLMAMLDKWEAVAVDVITGWNLEFFDLPYFINRLYRIFKNEEFINARLSVWGIVNKREFTVGGQFGGEEERMKYVLGGTSVIDMMDAYKKFAPEKQESYRLEHIANVELGEGKLSYDEYDSMHTFYKKDYPKFVEYNFKDVWLLNRIEDKLRLLEFIITLAYMAKVNYIDVFFPVRVIESVCYDYLINHKVVMKAKLGGKGDKTEKYSGAFVKDPKVGLHNWVVSFDLESLYPSLIRQLNLSPETLAPKYYNHEVDPDSLLSGKLDLSYARENNIVVAANGHHFTKDVEGFLPIVISRLIDGRKQVKKEMLDAERMKEKATGTAKKKLEDEISFKHLKQLALKILANSIYGAMGNQYFAFYDIRLAEAITKHGQYASLFIAGELNRYMNAALKTDGVDYVLYMDTDSVYLSFDAMVKKFRPDEKDPEKIVDFIDTVCQKKVSPWIDKAYCRMADYTNAYRNAMKMKREAIASRGVWKAKKMYALRVHDSEGVRYTKPKIKITGLETKRSSTPMFCREKLKEALELILTKSEKDVQRYVEDVRDIYYDLEAADIAFPRGVKDIEKWLSNNQQKKKKNDDELTVEFVSIPVFEGEEEKIITTTGTPVQVKAAHNYNTLLEKCDVQNEYRQIKSGDKLKFLYLKLPNPYNIKVIGFPNSLPKEFGLKDYIDRDLMFEASFLKPLRNVLDPVGWSPDYIETLEDFFV